MDTSQYILNALIIKNFPLLTQKEVKIPSPQPSPLKGRRKKRIPSP